MLPQMAAYALTIFTGAFLLFQVQPLMGKYILPWFGGGPGVWTTCMLFFQVLLLGGYAYAHFTSRWLKPRRQAVLHLVLLVAALALLPITPSDSWKPHGGGNPTLQILALLAASLGLPYFVLSATGPLIQHWFSRANPGASPYRLYALSNIGSLLALLSYPFYFENHFTRATQATLWACGLGVYALCCGICAFKLWKASPLAGTGIETMNPPGTGTSNIQHPTSNMQLAPGRQALDVGCSMLDVGCSQCSGQPPHPFPLPLGGGEGARRAGEGMVHGPHPGPQVTEALQSSPGAFPDPQLSTLNPQPLSQPPTLNHLLWLLLPACASVLLLATTNKLCQDVAVVPFLWVLPLALYLLSFVICFDSPRWYMRFPFTIALVAAMAGWCWALFYGADWELGKQVTVYCGGLFICCMVCHGELYRLKPDPVHLTRFYLMIAAGGALGGVLVAVAAPLVFTDYFELHWGLLLCGLLFLLICIFDRSQADWRWFACVLPLFIFVGLDWVIVRLARYGTDTIRHHLTGLRIGMWALVAFFVVSWIVRTRLRSFRHWHLLACLWLGLGVAGLGATLWMNAREANDDRVYRSRSFYGVLTVYEHQKKEPEYHHFVLQHGRITHGLQFVDPVRAALPVSYYGPQSGVAMGVDALPAGPRRIGVVGLGTGTMAAFARRGDTVRIYEINPQVQRVATTWFTYVPHCQGEVQIALGDARLSLEREPPQHFDLLVLDAFSSDAIPVHLLTREAFEVYQRHLNTNGIIAVHISNHYLDLEPVVVNLARQFGYKLAAIDYDDTENEDEWWLYSSTWILLTHDPQALSRPAIRDACYNVSTNAPRVPLWTDDFSSLFQVLK
ncbi:MAG TPA: fused MFS/spermidine synthase [Candidatus Acidoferrum sp.]|nr:fused MFS/spermidine synthase [Candidatus Acidoferrum sp.]